MVPLLLLLLPHPSRRQAKWCLLVGTAWLPSRQQPKNRRCVQALGPVVSAKAMCGGTASLRLCMLIGCGETQHSMKCQHRSQHVSHWPRDLCMCQSSSGLDQLIEFSFTTVSWKDPTTSDGLPSCHAGSSAAKGASQRRGSQILSVPGQSSHSQRIACLVISQDAYCLHVADIAQTLQVLAAEPSGRRNSLTSADCTCRMFFLCLTVCINS